VSRLESVLVSLFLSVSVPLTAFVAFWWGAASVSRHEGTIAGWALGGLGVGVALAVTLIVSRRRWFYAVPYAVAIPLYLFWAAIALASFMGLPVGLLVLGALVGLYVGRRSLRSGVAPERLDATTRNACVFVTGVTALGALAMGALAVGDEHTMQMLLGTVGLADLAATPGRRTLIVAVAIPVIAAVQLLATRRMIRLAYGRRVAYPGPGVPA